MATTDWRRSNPGIGNLSTLADTSIVSIATDDILIRNAAGVWVNKPIGDALITDQVILAQQVFS